MAEKSSTRHVEESPPCLKRLSVLTLSRLYAPILDLHLNSKMVRSIATPLRAMSPELQAEFVRVLTFEFERHWEPVGDYTAPEVDPLLDMLEYLDASALTHFKFLCYPFQSGILALRIKAFRSLSHLSLQFFGDDKLMSAIGNNCPQLKEVDVWHSVLVTDKGIARFCLKKCVYTRNLWAKALKGIRALHFTATRSNYECLPNEQKKTAKEIAERAKIEEPRSSTASPKSRRETVKTRKYFHQAYEEDELNPCLKTLELMDLRDTGASFEGVAFLTSHVGPDCRILFTPRAETSST